MVHACHSDSLLHTMIPLTKHTFILITYRLPTSTDPIQEVYQPTWQRQKHSSKNLPMVPIHLLTLKHLYPPVNHYRTKIHMMPIMNKMQA